MATLADIRELVRDQLRDVAETIWSDAQLELHVKRALRMYSEIKPLQKKSTIAHAAGARTIPLSTITDRLAVVRIEYPVDEYPPSYVPFNVWADIATMDLAEAPAGTANTYIFWHAQHTINGTTSFPATDNQIIATGAVGLACQALTADVANKVAVAGEAAWGRYADMANTHLAMFLGQLAHLREAEQNRIRSSTLYSPATTRTSSQSTDPGPV